MQALLVLYMVEFLLLPAHVGSVAGLPGLRRAIESITGPLSPQALASQIFGLYVGLVFFTPVIGGLIGDRFLGRRHTVVLGALLLTVGHFCMSFERPFLMALLLILLGAGCLRGNLLAQVGNLYQPDDRRRADGYQIYVAMLNSGALFAPLITGALAATWGWHYGFSFAAFGMLAGLAIYLSGQRYLPADPPRDTSLARRRLDKGERRTVAVLLLMLPLFSLFWIAQSQVWNTYNIWARDHVDLSVGHWTIPVAWLQTADGVGAVAMMPPLVLFWRWQAARGKEPDEYTKIAIGCLFYGALIAWLALGSLFVNDAGKIPLAWVLAFHVVSQIGYLYVSPTAVALFSRTAPAAVNGTMVNVYYASAFLGSTISGRLGGLYERLPSSMFWLLHAGIAAAGGVLMLLFAPSLRRALLRSMASQGAT